MGCICICRGVMVRNKGLQESTRGHVVLQDPAPPLFMSLHITDYIKTPEIHFFPIAHLDWRLYKLTDTGSEGSQSQFTERNKGFPISFVDICEKPQCRRPNIMSCLPSSVNFPWGLNIILTSTFKSYLCNSTPANKWLLYYWLEIKL